MNTKHCTARIQGQ